VRNVDVVVVGAGPAGTAAAITLARAGQSVAVLDKARFPRDKCCGDGLTTGALRLLEQLGLPPADVASWQPVDDVRVHSPSGRTATFPFPRGRGLFAAVARRSDLDSALVDTARRAGAVVLDGHAFESIEQFDDRVVVHASDLDPLMASYVIGADGMWSPLRKAVGAGEDGYLGEWHAFRQYFDGTAPDARDLHVWFERDLLPGYAWSFPLPGGGANVGFGVPRNGRIRTRDMKALWPDLLARPRIREVLGADAHAEGPHRAWPIPARVNRVTLSRQRVLFVGDAAAATDPMTGEGIGQALLTGTLAARAIAAGDARDAASVRRHYEQSARRGLVADHYLSALLLRVLQRERGARGALRLAGATPWIRRNFARWLFEDYPRALLATPRRWHRGTFSGDGAFAAR
jgi:menaquinone-9 beta-reductase